MLSLLGNILWFILIGLGSGILWTLFGVLWCITLVGIPIGLQCFKMAGLAFFPFGKTIVYSSGTFSFLVNILWIFLCGWELALFYLVWGLIFCITVVGIPVGLQSFKMAKLALMPFGASVRS